MSFSPRSSVALTKIARILALGSSRQMSANNLIILSSILKGERTIYKLAKSNINETCPAINLIKYSNLEHMSGCLVDER
ncbi:hypothetical protein CEXT_26561 [Caerostris extrusa]|uniref:Uncharacterized protein n=1 Tax=Caerostris extrusa TaxID=172846 RepID=A0AAV4N6Q1_CAEEX|nr:hypothetical protein CEXT_26561 [Caerostris extrusa]